MKQETVLAALRGISTDSEAERAERMLDEILALKTVGELRAFEETLDIGELFPVFSERVVVRRFLRKEKEIARRFKNAVRKKTVRRVIF